MKFEIVDTAGEYVHPDYVSRYIIEDFSFEYECKNYFHDFFFTMHTLKLSIDTKFSLCGVSGYDPYLGWKKIHTEPPVSEKGGVHALVNFDYVPGLGYSIID
ncbi:MAG: hypothetical protein ACX93T_01920 [Bacteroidota bacterium]